MTDRPTPELAAKIQECIDEVNACKKQFRNPDELVAYLQNWLKCHAPNEVLEWQEQRRRRLQVN
jgi:hypothetical protein